MACIALAGSAEDNLHFQISIGRPPPPPVASGLAAAPEGKHGEKSVKRLQGRCSICEVTIDLALIQKPARTPDKTPLQAIGHSTASPSEGSALAYS